MTQKITKNLNNYFSQRDKQKQEYVKKLLAQNNYATSGYTMFQEKSILQVLHKNNQISITQQMKNQQQRFYLANLTGLGVGIVSCIFPHLIRQFYFAKRWKKNVVRVLIVSTMYTFCVLPQYMGIRTRNQQLIKNYAHLLK